MIHQEMKMIPGAGKQETKLAESIVLVLTRRLNTQQEPLLQFKSKHRKSQCFSLGVKRHVKKLPN